MIIGHLPTGYILSRFISKKISKNINLRLFTLFALLGAIAPDIDMLYFYFIDNQQHHHHTYWTHYPIFWLTPLLCCLFAYQVTKFKSLLFSLIFLLNGFFHLVIDTLSGDIWWFAPFINKSYVLFQVPALYQPWWLNFIFHWTFGFEIIAIIWAVLLYRNHKVN